MCLQTHYFAFDAFLSLYSFNQKTKAPRKMHDELGLKMLHIHCKTMTTETLSIAEFSRVIKFATTDLT